MSSTTDALLQRMLEKMAADAAVSEQLQHALAEVSTLRDGQAKLTARIEAQDVEQANLIRGQAGLTEEIAQLKLEVAVLKCQQQQSMGGGGGCRVASPGGEGETQNQMIIAARSRNMPSFIPWAEAWFPCRSLKESPQGSDDYYVPIDYARGFVELCSHYPWIVYFGFSMWKRLLYRMYAEAKPELGITIGGQEPENDDDYRYGANGNLCHLLHLLPRVGNTRRASDAFGELTKYEDGTSTDRTRETVKTSLHYFKYGAVANNQQDAVVLMINELRINEDIIIRDGNDYRSTMVRVAIDQGHYALVKRLVKELGHDIGALQDVDLEGMESNRRQQRLHLQLDLGANPNVLDFGPGWTPLHEAVEEDYLRALEIILGHGQQLQRQQPQQQQSSLSRNQSEEQDRHHHEADDDSGGALDLEIVDTVENSTPLQLAIKKNRIEHVKRLLEHGAKLRPEDKSTDPEINKLLREHRGGSGGGETNNGRAFRRKNKNK